MQVLYSSNDASMMKCQDMVGRNSHNPRHNRPGILMADQKLLNVVTVSLSTSKPHASLRDSL